MFENRVLRKIFGPNNDEATGARMRYIKNSYKVSVGNPMRRTKRRW
jgi:hypothetical protein